MTFGSGSACWASAPEHQAAIITEGNPTTRGKTELDTSSNQRRNKKS